MSLQWGGWNNGQVPFGSMVAVQHFAPVQSGANPGVGSNLLEPNAARQVGLLDTAFDAHFGKPLNKSECYRDMIRQTALYQLSKSGGALAAYPGTSNHGFGRAVDFGQNIETFGSPEKVWMDANAPKYGWNPAGNGFSSPEAWHFEYSLTPTITTAAETITVIVETETEMADHTYLVTTSNSGLDKSKNQGILGTGRYFLFDINGRALYSVSSVEAAIGKSAGDKVVGVPGPYVWNLVDNGVARKRF